MHTVQRRFVVFLNKACSRNVRHDHALFDQFVCIVAQYRLDALNAFFRIENKFRFFGFKGNRTALITGFRQRFIEFVQFFQVFHQRRIVFTQLFIPFEDFPHLGIGQTGVGAHYRFIETVTGKLTFRRNGHFTHHTQAINLRVQ